MGKMCWNRRATDDITRHMPLACCITKVTATHSECAIVVFPRQNLVVNALQEKLSYNWVTKLKKKKSANFRKMASSHLKILGARKVT